MNLYHLNATQVSRAPKAEGHDRVLSMAVVNDGEVAQLERGVGKGISEGEQYSSANPVVPSVTNGDILLVSSPVLINSGVDKGRVILISKMKTPG